MERAHQQLRPVRLVPPALQRLLYKLPPLLSAKDPPHGRGVPPPPALCPGVGVKLLHTLQRADKAPVLAVLPRRHRQPLGMYVPSLYVSLRLFCANYVCCSRNSLVVPSLYAPSLSALTSVAVVVAAAL